MLTSETDINAKNDQGNTSLMEAIRDGAIEKVQLLIEHGADINAKGDRGETSLISAARGGKTEIVHLLLEKGADVNLQGINDKTALMWAARGGYRKITELLLEKSAEVNIRDNQGNTALIWAASKKGNAEIINLLLKNRADVPLEKLDKIHSVTIKQVLLACGMFNEQELSKDVLNHLYGVSQENVVSEFNNLLVQEATFSKLKKLKNI